MGRKGYHIESGFVALSITVDVRFEGPRTRSVFAVEKFFCGFSLLEKVADHTYFSHLRAKIGTKRLAELFISEIFNFVDASQIVSKVSLWNERDKAIKKVIKTFNFSGVE